MFGVSLDLNLTPLAAFFYGFKRKKAARGVRFKSGLVWRLLRVLCFDLTYLCNKDENRWNDEFFVSADLIHRFPSVDEHTHGLGFDDWLTITCLNYQNLPEIEHQNAARHWSSSASQGLQFLLWRHRGARSRGGSRSQRSVSLIASEKIASTTAGTEDINENETLWSDVVKTLWMRLILTYATNQPNWDLLKAPSKNFMCL